MSVPFISFFQYKKDIFHSTEPLKHRKFKKKKKLFFSPLFPVALFKKKCIENLTSSHSRGSWNTLDKWLSVCVHHVFYLRTER